MANNTHAYYTYPIILDVNSLNITRDIILKALEAEGVPGLANGYQNIHLLPIYQKKIGYGSNGFPWSSSICKRNVNYAKGICPIAEECHDQTVLNYFMCTHELDNNSIDLMIEAFGKVWRSLDELSTIQSEM